MNGSMDAEVMRFQLDLRKFVKDELPGRANAFKRKIGLEVLRRVVMKSPVGNPDLWQSPPPSGYVGGHFRANWMASIRRVDDSTTDAIDKDGGKTIAEGTVKVLAAKVGDDIWISNNLPYAIPLEKGHSTQAPMGMVALTVAEINTHFARAD